MFGGVWLPTLAAIVIGAFATEFIMKLFGRNKFNVAGKVSYATITLDQQLIAMTDRPRNRSVSRNG